MLMKNYFSMQTLVTVLVALILFEVLNRLFLNKVYEKIAPTSSYESSYEDYNYDDDDDDEI